MTWEQIAESDQLNRDLAKQWEVERKSLCPECETQVVYDTDGKRGCVFCGWSERL